MGNLTNLEQLYLNDNVITALPVEIGNLSSLLSLNLSGQYDSGYTLTTIPAEINTTQLS